MHEVVKTPATPNFLPPGLPCAAVRSDRPLRDDGGSCEHRREFESSCARHSEKRLQAAVSACRRGSRRARAIALAFGWVLCQMAALIASDKTHISWPRALANIPLSSAPPPPCDGLLGVALDQFRRTRRGRRREACGAVSDVHPSFIDGPQSSRSQRRCRPSPPEKLGSMLCRSRQGERSTFPKAIFGIAEVLCPAERPSGALVIFAASACASLGQKRVGTLPA
jgi:hypothetical protein